MDSDRKSTVSSFYGGRRSSVDALKQRLCRPCPNVRPASPPPARTNGAGYNRMSYFDAGREEPVKGGHDEAEQPNEGGWDVYADFNNKGPRYSHAFGIGKNDASYQQLSPQLTGKMDEESSTQGPVELVTVPALGAEWGKDELKDMTKRGRREKEKENFGRKWKAFNRGEYGMFGRKWLTRRTVVFFIFGLCAAIGIILAFTIPRVPGFAISGKSPLVSATGWFNQSVPVGFSRFPANFSFPAALSLQVDTGSNFLPLVFKNLDAQLYDLDSFRLVGIGHLNHTKLPAKKFSSIQMPVNFTYVATNDSDQTWINWYNACKNKAQYTGGERPGLRFRLNIDMNIAGLPTKHSTATSVTNAPCPIELPSSAG
ncbi:hypothetical protein BJY52DRAFT_1205520 [Lactarius psammicola]|nr:hypothetical protein BJY52DRAFT_1205520 [Lactarius psammicola]